MNTETNELIKSLTADFQPIVDAIEKTSVRTTQNNYGKYLELLCTFCNGSNDPMLQIVTGALLDAGANDSGLASAYKIYKG